MGIFEPRANFKPYEYPEAITFVKDLQSSIWNVDEFNFTTDIQDFNTNLNEHEKEVIRRTMLAISQIEISVKTFWGRLFDHLPKPEFNTLGTTMAYTEVNHELSYSEILEKLGLNDDFKQLLLVPEIKGRVDYMQKYLKNASSTVKQEYTLNLALFSAFIENCSLFSQFFIAKSFKQHKNVFNAVDNVISATMLEEVCNRKGTEVMTPNGWIPVENMKIGDDIFTFKEGNIYLEKVINTIEKENPHKKMVEFGNYKHSVIMTPDHNILYWKKDGWGRQPVDEFNEGNSAKFIPVTGRYNSDYENSLSFDERVYIAVQADGCRLYLQRNKNGEKSLRGKNGGMNYVLALFKERKIERMRWLLKNSSIEWSERIIKHRKGKKSGVEFLVRVPFDIDFKLFDWVDLSKVSRKWCEEFIEEILMWDGYDKRGEKSYSSIVKENIDKVQSIAVLAGWRTNVYEGQESKRKESYNNCWKLSISQKDKVLTHSHTYKKRYFDSDERVACVTVPAGGLIVRHENKVSIVGNCHAQVGSWLISLIKSEYPEWFDDTFEKKIIRACKKAYNAEMNIVEWIMQGKDLDFLSRKTIDHYLRNRFNLSLKMMGLDPIFEVDEEEYKKFEWFELESELDRHTDFFNQRPSTYARDKESVTKDDLF